eukprot:TRINITY_DN65547_c0_g1_i1.p1 TRINITY_DN65547_c0_g1~~TRINITY_DN65547_c0_g1_i1.p1  ORF type:complete len:130 (-),score=8.45 TRINITY_DN65547_c0_g1_i1:87-476(-)
MLLSAVRRGRIPREIVFAVAKGMYGRSKRCFKLAVTRVMKELDHQYYLRHRLPSKMRTIWITRINPAAREHGLTYSRLISGLRGGNIRLDRKSLCNLAETEPVTFKCLVDEAKRISFPRSATKRDLTGF